MTLDTATMKRWITRGLLGFVLITIGFAAGRRTAPQASPTESTSADDVQAAAAKPDRVVVYAAHMTFRCQECNQIEWLARELVENEFAAERKADRLEFRTVDYMQNTDFAKRYNISSSTVVVVRFEDGKEQDFKRLDEVWTKVKKREEFFEYVRTAIRESLGKGDST